MDDSAKKMLSLGVANAFSSEAVSEEEDVSINTNAGLEAHEAKEDAAGATSATVPDSSETFCPVNSEATPVIPIQEKKEPSNDSPWKTIKQTASHQ